jgi:hypothetical protein
LFSALFQFGSGGVLIVSPIEQDEIIADRTCRAEPGLESDFGIHKEWEGEFFPGISKIKYEVWPFYFLDENGFWLSALYRS